MSAANDWDRPDVVPRVTNYSELRHGVEGCRLLAPLYWGFAIVVVSVVLAIVLLLSPLLVLITVVRRIAFCRLRYRRPPSDVRIAVVGGGWGGMQCAERLLELGIQPVCYERFDKVGGIWHRNSCYHGQQLHGPMWITSFSDTNGTYKFCDCQDAVDGKVRADAMEGYMDRFFEDHALSKCYKFNTKVVGVQMDSTTGKATLDVQDGGEVRRDGPFDLIIWASLAGEPMMPRLPGMDAFQGLQLHTMHVNSLQFDALLESGKRIAVVGGSKAASDMMVNFERAGYRNVLWVYKAPYLFLKFESMMHGRSILGMVRGFFLLCGFLLALVSAKLMGLFLWSIDALCSADGTFHADTSKFHLGVLCTQQRQILSRIDKKRQVSGSHVQRLVKNGAVLEDGTLIEADCIIWATGNSPGLTNLKLEKDGRPFEIKAGTFAADHFIVPDFPVLASGGCMITTFGPVRGRNNADMAVYHLCVRKPTTENDLIKRISWQLSSNSVTTSLIWSSKASLMRTWLLMHIDWLKAGLIGFDDMAWHLIEIFVFNRQSMYNMRIVPNRMDVQKSNGFGVYECLLG